jgi:hypothetical protein
VNNMEDYFSQILQLIYNVNRPQDNQRYIFSMDKMITRFLMHNPMHSIGI